ncbi:bZIP transcription factor 17-like [Rutidosis leptorrhynchoides]|uniref:bZIP transcription factor 17-like n=1 Tax=Rutidosis leptorrhynchoides TaxID=125765 RepID=UPI003A9A4594
MAETDPVLAAQQPLPLQNPHEFDALPIPPLDPLFISSDDPVMTDLDFNFDDNFELDFTLHDFDDFYFPSETEPISVIPSDNSNSNTLSPESGSSVVLGCDHIDLGGAEASGLWISPSGENSGSLTSGQQPSREEFSAAEPVSSHGSGNFVSGESSGPVKYSSDSSSENFVVEQNAKLEGIRNGTGFPKRKKGSEDIDSHMRKTKCRKPEKEKMVFKANLDSVKEMSEDEKRKIKLLRNRESAQISRQRKRHYVEELEEKVRRMQYTIAQMNGQLSYFMTENVTLRQQLFTGGANNTSPMMYPPPPMGYHPMVAPPYMVNGSKVPLVPIPRLNPQSNAPAQKAKKTESKKSSGGRTKKVASVTFLGLLFFILLFGGLAPIVNMKFGGMKDEVTGGFYDQHRGGVISVDSFRNGSGVDHEGMKFKRSSGSDGLARVHNGSEPLVASLYVPRNDALVKIEGNLIIHSVLACDKARASQKENNTETGLAVPRDLHAALEKDPQMLHRNPSKRPKAIAPGASHILKDHKKSPAADGKVQQWFREDLAGPFLSSGMCSEVFQFDVSSAPASGAIIPVSTITNTSGKHEVNSTNINRGRNRRILRGLPVPLPGSKVNFTAEQLRETSRRANFKGNGSASSPVVVSILVDPREAADVDMVSPKSISRIFVVVLIDSVKYITYSCMLPRTGTTHMVTA